MSLVEVVIVIGLEKITFGWCNKILGMSIVNIPRIFYTVVNIVHSGAFKIATCCN